MALRLDKGVQAAAWAARIGTGWKVAYTDGDMKSFSAHFPDLEHPNSLVAALEYARHPSLAGKGLGWLTVERYQ